MTDATGIWKPILKASSPEHMADRLHMAFNRYFPPCHARTISVSRNRFEGELSKLPACMMGLYTASTVGFVRGALELAGAHRVQVDFGRPGSDGEHLGVPVARVRFTAIWTDVAPDAGAVPSGRAR